MSRRALITNDDGVGSAGLAALAATVLEAGYDVVVAAPTWDSSGSSSALTAVEHDGRLLLERRELAGVEVDEVYGVEASPAFIVRAALSGAFGAPPDLVCSGINHGANVGHVILHSGTVGAVLTAATYGVPGLAVSLSASGSPEAQWHFVTAVVVVREVLGLVGDDGEAPLAVNLNVPGVEPGQLRDIRSARLARLGAVQASVTEEGAGWVRLDFEPTGSDLEPGTDATLLEHGYATLTPLSPVCEAAGVDLGERLLQRSSSRQSSASTSMS